MKKNKQSNTKKIFYLVLLVIGLLLIGQFFKNQERKNEPFIDETLTISNGPNDSVIAEDEVIGVDADGNALIGDAVEVIEENPDETGDEGETVVKE